jgi:hypothetical protein
VKGTNENETKESKVNEGEAGETNPNVLRSSISLSGMANETRGAEMEKTDQKGARRKKEPKQAKGQKEKGSTRHQRKKKKKKKRTILKKRANKDLHNLCIRSPWTGRRRMRSGITQN